MHWDDTGQWAKLERTLTGWAQAVWIHPFFSSSRRIEQQKYSPIDNSELLVESTVTTDCGDPA